MTMMTARQKEIHDKTVDMLLDNGTIHKVNPNMIESFAVLLYQSEQWKGIDSLRYNNLKTSADLIALQELNLKEDEVNTI